MFTAIVILIRYGSYRTLNHSSGIYTEPFYLKQILLCREGRIICTYISRPTSSKLIFKLVHPCFLRTNSRAYNILVANLNSRGNQGHIHEISASTSAERSSLNKELSTRSRKERVYAVRQHCAHLPRDRSFFRRIDAYPDIPYCPRLEEPKHPPIRKEGPISTATTFECDDQQVDGCRRVL